MYVKCIVFKREESWELIMLCLYEVYDVGCVLYFKFIWCIVQNMYMC